MDLKLSQLEQAFKAFFINKGGDPNARLFVWFAGHGRTENGEGFLIPADAPRPEVGRKFKFAALPMRRFGEYVRLTESNTVSRCSTPASPVPCLKVPASCRPPP